MAIPKALYPLCTPLPIPVAEHLLEHLQQQIDAKAKGWSLFEKEIREICALLPIPTTMHLLEETRYQMVTASKAWEPFEKEIREICALLPIPTTMHLLKRIQQQTVIASKAWKKFQKEITEKRWIAFLYMNSFVQENLAGSAKGSPDRYSTAWFLRTLTAETPGKRPVVRGNLTLWTERGLYRSSEHGLPDRNRASALYVARMIDKKRLRGWLPSEMDFREPDWWCWRQDSPSSPIVPCPIPFPEDLPAGALLWTPWSGASWDPTWLLTDVRRGSIRFASTIRSRIDGRPRWNVSEPDLLAWCPSLAPLAVDLHDPDFTPIEAQNLRHSLATDALQRLVRGRLSLPF
jgi:hypothetical protein